MSFTISYEEDDDLQSMEEFIASVTKDRIRRTAYSLWEDRGRPEGRDLEFWLEAEYLVKKEFILSNLCAHFFIFNIDSPSISDNHLMDDLRKIVDTWC